MSWYLRNKRERERLRSDVYDIESRFNAVLRLLDIGFHEDEHGQERAEFFGETDYQELRNMFFDLAARVRKIEEGGKV